MSPNLITWLVAIGVVGLAIFFAWMENKKT